MLKIKVFDELKVMADELRKAYKMEQQMDPSDSRFIRVRRHRERIEKRLKNKLRAHEEIIEAAASFHETEENFHPYHPTH